MTEMATNNPRRVPGLHGICEDPSLPEEDAVIDAKLKPSQHFHYGKEWDSCIDGIKRQNLLGKKPWQRGLNKPAESDPKYIEKYKIRMARESALKMLESKSSKIFD